VDSVVYGRPRQLTPALVLGALDLLPFDQMEWDDFEKLQCRVLRDVEGLRNAQIYGEPGQAQQGLDVVALTPGRSGVALQSKRLARFGKAQLRAAVGKFRATERPFQVERLIIGVSREVRSTGAVAALHELRSELAPLALDLWDKQALSDLLRNAPEIVIEFFGIQTAERFCLPFEHRPLLVPDRDAVTVREALARTPEEATGASAMLEQSAGLATDPKRALELVEAAQETLRLAGFASHAAQHEPERARLLVQLGRGEEAARAALNEVWLALDQGSTTAAEIARQRVHERVREAELHSTDPDRQWGRVADLALELYMNPMTQLGPAESLAIGESGDRLRLAVLAGEIALANNESAWLRDELPALIPLKDLEHAEPGLVVRLRLLDAEARQDWDAVLTDARRLRLGHELGSLVSARYARHCAMLQRFVEADACWDDAAGDACLAKRWADASTWVFSRRAFRTHWQPFSRDDLLSLEIALGDMGPSSRVVPTDERAHERAMQDLADGKLRAAAIHAQRALRDAVVSSDWVQEINAREVLANILIEADEPEVAAHHLIRAGAIKRLESLAGAYPNRFIDASADLQAPNYWTVSATYRLLSAQSDLIPDEAILRLAASILADLRAADDGTLVDLRPFATSRYLAAVHLLARIASRLPPELAEEALAHFERQPEVAPNHYRYHDDDEALTVAGVAQSQPFLRNRAIPHLVDLLARSQTARGHETTRPIHSFWDLARPHLLRHAALANSWAHEVLASRDPTGTPPEVVVAALKRLVTPLVHTPGAYTMGTGAIGDATLVSSQDPAVLEQVVDELLRRADDPHVGSSDRGDYLLAAAQLADGLTERARSVAFTRAVECATSPTPSEYDDMQRLFRHKLGAVRVGGSGLDSRGKALFLAARLAGTDDQFAEVRTHAFAQLVGDETSDYWTTRALQQLNGGLEDDIGFLASQGWALRSLAAILWVRRMQPGYVGVRLAHDQDVRVRRSLADALSHSQNDSARDEIRTILLADPAYSVRIHLLEKAE